MLTCLSLTNFKRFDTSEIPLGKAVVLIGPNNSGKTTALQALALWDAGLRRWNEKRLGKSSPKKRPGVTINRRDLISIPVPSANLLWRDLHVRNVERIGDKTKTQNVRIDVIVSGVTRGHSWSCGLEFDYANEESFYCRPLRKDGDSSTARMSIPPEAGEVRIAYLPPMSGLAAVEPRWEPGRINVLIGEGQTAQVLRNLCYQVYESQITDPNGRSGWERVVAHIESLFGVSLLPPKHIPERGEITLGYRERSGPELDLCSAGRGLQQTLLLLAHMYANPKTVLLLDEPDAHLEILRQRQIFELLTNVAESQGSQVIAASHSEVILNEAAGRGTVIAFVGTPHRMNDRGTQIIKSLTDLGWDQYYQAEQGGWVLYLEDSTDLAILRAFAETLKHPATSVLERPFVHYVSTNLPQRARDHFFGLREAKDDLVGIALFDRLDKELHTDSPLVEMMWTRREIENYFCTEEVLLAYARHDQPDDLFGLAEAGKREETMREAIADITDALDKLGKPSPWSPDVKASDDFLDPLFKAFFRKLELPISLRKSDYHFLAHLVPRDALEREIIEKLDAIVSVAERAKPKQD